MRYSKIHKLDVSNGEGVGVALFVQGCHFCCKNCFNSETWDFNKGKKWNQEILNKFIDLADRPYITRITLLGGEPLADENLLGITNLLIEIRKRFGNTKTVWLYTGYTIEELIQAEKSMLLLEGKCNLRESNKIINETLLRHEILTMCDVLVDGQYIDELKDISLKFRGSSNQRIINVKKSLEENQVVLYMK